MLAQNAITKNQATPLIGVFVNSAEDKYENALLQGIFEAVQEQNGNLICFTSGALRSYHGFEAKRNILYDLVDKKMLAGLVIAGTLGHNISQKEVAQLCNRYRPLPMVSVALMVKGIPALMVDSLGGMQKIVDHLIEAHGYRRIGFICGPLGQREADSRYQAYLNSLEEHGLHFDSDLVAEGDYTRPSGVLAMRRLLHTSGKKLDAVVAANDSMALGAMQMLEEEGLRIAVTGFDDTDDGRYYKIPLTTVRQSAYEQGYLAGKMLFSMQAGQAVPSETLAPAAMVVRQSCGCGLETPKWSLVDANQGATLKPVPIETCRDVILSAVTSAASLLITGLPPDWAQKLYESLAADIKEPGGEAFLRVWSGLLSNEKIAGDELIWQNILFAMQQATAPSLRNIRGYAQTWIIARQLISDASARQQAEQRIRTEQQATALRELGESMVTTFNMGSLLDVIMKNLPSLGVRACFLSLYEDPQKPVRRSRLILAYDGYERIELPPTGKVFPSSELVPNGRLRTRRKGSLVVEALYSKQTQLGFVVLELAPSQAVICGTLRGLLSSALQGILLLQQREQVEAELRRYQNTLEELVYQRTQALRESNVSLQREMNERQQAEATIRMYADIVDTMQVGMYIIRADDLNDDTSLRIVAANPAALLYSEKTADEVIGKRLEDVFKTFRGKGVPEKYLQVIKTGVPAYFEDLYETDDGILSEAYSVDVFQLTPHSAGVLFENIYEQKVAGDRLRQFNAQLEQRVQERTAQLEAANKELEAFSYSVSHDLRAPLRAIVGYASIVQSDFSEEMPDQGRAFMQRIAEGGKQMGQLIDDLLSFSRTSRATIRKQVIDMERFVQDVWEEVIVSYPNSVVEFKCSSLPTCNADRGLFKQVLVNLLSNAVKYSQNRDPARVEVGSQVNNGEVIYFVKDNGAGFDMKYAGKLFGVFQRLHRSEEFDGTGIGLATAQRIISRHGGQIWAEAEVDRGATFYFTLGND